MVDLAAAERTVMTAQGRITIATQKMALRAAWQALDDVLLGPDHLNLMTQAEIDAVEQALIGFEAALAALTAVDLTDEDKFNATNHAMWGQERAGEGQAIPRRQYRGAENGALQCRHRPWRDRP